MPQTFDIALNAHATRDEDGLARDVVLTEQPYLARGATPQLAAREYLETSGAELGIERDQLRHLELPPEDEPVEAGVEYRFVDERRQFDTTTVSFSQTMLGLPVWEAGVVVHLASAPLRVIAAQSTLHRDVELEPPSTRALARLRKLGGKALADRLGLSEVAEEFAMPEPEVERRRLVVYRYDASRRVLPRHEDETEGEHRHLHPHVHLPVPELGEEIEHGRHYLAAELIFVLGTPAIPDLRWMALVDVDTLSILYLRALVDTVDGLVFHNEPMTDNGGPLPSATSAALNPLRTAVQLQGLNPPAPGSYALSGKNVALLDTEPPTAAAPTEAVGTDFDFDARTDEFAAVNAYYHADRFFRLVEDLGFDLSSYFGGTLFPTSVDHRGMGVTVNAHCLGNGSFGILRTAFALADLGNVANPIGIACDYRVVLHELAGHGVLYNYVNGPNFLFSHSAGDSFAAVLNDAESRAPDRFVTFPWVNIGRRHDRTPAAGWGWSGAIALSPFSGLDPGGYNNEQILCTTHFRLYRALGGDSTEVAMRDYAARYTAYLMLRAIGSISPAANPPNAGGWATTLMVADIGNWTSQEQVGGVYSKVIRWAFEKQGLYQPIAKPKPNNDPGAPPDVDVYVDDGRGGEYDYAPGGQDPALQRFWETTEVWNRRHPDAHHKHQTPIVGERNYAYLIVRNRGTQAASGVRIHGYHCRPAAGLVWPDDFKPMTTDVIDVPGTIPAGADVVVGPLEWKPEHRGHECMFMTVTAIADRANTDPATMLPCASGPTPLWRLVPCDNNLALRAVIPVPGGGHRRALVASFHERRFWAANPFARTGKVEVRADVPAFLATRGWEVKLDNPGAGSFSLGPRDAREIKPRLIGGRSFTAAELTAAGHVAIDFVVLVDGLVVGGLTYVLDPKLEHPARELTGEEEHENVEPAVEDEEREGEPEHEEHDREPRRIKFEIDVD
ncbi:MAG TPA: hypothetical protein VG365_06975 [Solirubrobacteraceae bacterium]|nr:hypothetical protein [Solirubrobacteraceae bacterium]